MGMTRAITTEAFIPGPIIHPCGLAAAIIPGMDRGLVFHLVSGTARTTARFILIRFSMTHSTFITHTGLVMVLIMPGITDMDAATMAMGAIITDIMDQDMCKIMIRPGAMDYVPAEGHRA